MENETEFLQKIEKLKELRGLLAPKNLLFPNGSIDPNYFRSRNKEALHENWVHDKNHEKLVKGIEKYGIGSWKKIKENLLPDWSETVLMIRTIQLIGKQNLTEYVGKKFTEEQLEAERKKNVQYAAENNLLANGVLIDSKYKHLI
eukprot:maker-scaffold_1-snap-gene-22.63-mRNA-1 protein AED:0.00 eAED:0.00 QI:71/1/1/1/0/0/2/101/144